MCWFSVSDVGYGKIKCQFHILHYEHSKLTKRNRNLHSSLLLFANIIMQLSALFLSLVVFARSVTCTSDFDLYDDDGTFSKLAEQEHITSVHIILDGLSSPLNAEQIQAVNEAFKDSYNEIYGDEGFRMESVEVIEQRVYNPERKFLRASPKSTLRFEPDSYVTLVSNLKGTSGAHLGAFGDADYRTLMQRFWERKACQIILTGKYTSAELRMCYMTSPRRRAQMFEPSTTSHLQVMMA